MRMSCMDVPMDVPMEDNAMLYAVVESVVRILGSKYQSDDSHDACGCVFVSGMKRFVSIVAAVFVKARVDFTIVETTGLEWRHYWNLIKPSQCLDIGFAAFCKGYMHDFVYGMAPKQLKCIAFSKINDCLYAMCLTCNSRRGGNFCQLWWDDDSVLDHGLGAWISTTLTIDPSA